MTVLEKEPINLGDLLEFYGEEQTQQILEIFQENTQQILKRIEFFLKERNGKALAGLAHELKASSASISAKQLTKLSLYLEQASGQEDWLEAEETLSSLKKSFDYLKDYLLNTASAKVATS
jgi:HPt (histidine-containing phosphotransfer) domain-containing protein